MGPVISRQNNHPFVCATFDKDFLVCVCQYLLIPTIAVSHIHSRARRGMERSHPNILITGTPGVGKTSHCEALTQRSNLRYVSINRVVKEKDCHEGWDKDQGSYIVDEDKVSLD